MYIDGVILFSLAVIALILWMMGYIGLYAYRHIKKDIAEHNELAEQQEPKAPTHRFDSIA